MTITADYQAELPARSLLLGAGTNYRFGKQGFTGFGVAGVRTKDQDRGDKDGGVGGYDVLSSKILALPLHIGGGVSAGTAYGRLRTLKAGWRPSTAELELDVRLPGFPSSDSILRYFGRPRGCDANLEDIAAGYIAALVTFHALDPFGYGPTVTTAGSGTVVVTNAGDALTDRVTITITGSGGTPRIDNPDDGGGYLAFATPVSGTRVVDLRARTVVDGSSVDKFTEIAPGSPWFRLQPGANNLALTGATSISVVHRPAWH